MMTLTIGMLVTFAALVLGLITASVKAGYDDAVHYRQEYALQLTELDRCLRNYGSGADAARAYLRSYTAAAIASIWPSEPPPVGVQYPDISGMHNLVIAGEVPAHADLMNRVGLEITVWQLIENMIGRRPMPLIISLSTSWAEELQTARRRANLSKLGTDFISRAGLTLPARTALFAQH